MAGKIKDAEYNIKKLKDFCDKEEIDLISNQN